MKLFSSKRRWAAVALILLALFLVRPGASRLKSRIIFSISASVGRPVDIGAVHIRLLPRPGFDLQNLVVYDDPSFSAEPILRASEVTAVLRLTSLVHGRLEVARLDLTEPSLNLVHGEAGHWNLEALLERTARLPLAPTGKTKSEPRPAFPYIEGTSARINFKNGPEKKPYALTNADFSLWQDSENSWGVRLKAQPFRTDKNLNDMGLLQVNATWQRAPTIRDTPLQGTIEWSRAQLGQITKFISGNDQGWRGTILLDVSFKGTPAKLAISSTAAIDDFRRYDITSGKALRLAGYCDGEYRSETQDFHQVMCSAPVGDGLITLTGDMALPSRHRYSLVMTAEKVPVKAAVMLAQRAKRNLPDDLAADGTINASLSMQADSEAGSSNRFQGRGEITDFHLVSAGNKAEIGPVSVPLAINNDSSTESARKRRVGKNGRLIQVPGDTYLEIGPVAMSAPHAGSPMMTAWISRGGYTLTITGEAEITKTLRVARMAGLPALLPAADGSAQMNLRIAGAWAGPIRGDGGGFAAPLITGDAKLRGVQVAAHTFGGPVAIVSADMQFMPDTIRVGKLTAKAGGTTWMGSLEMPRGCGTPDACPVRFVLNANQVTIADISEWVNSGPKKRPWYRVLESNAETHPSIFGSLRASGRLTADHLKVRRMDATHVSANVNLERGKLQLSQVNATLASGEHRGEWKVDFSVKPALCVGSGNLSELSLAALADAMNEEWIAGTANATYQVRGPCPADFWQSADGTLQAEIQDGVFPHISISDSRTEPLRVTRMNGQARLHAGKIEITDTNIDSPEGKFQLVGTASLQREIDLKLTRVSNPFTNSGYSISGTLAEPRITPLTASEQAGLKALPTK